MLITNGESGVSARIKINAATLKTRAEAVTWQGQNTVDDGFKIRADGLEYVKSDGATVISDMPGWLPYGDVISYRHFDIDASYADNESEIQAAANYAKDGKTLIIPRGRFVSNGNIVVEGAVGMTLKGVSKTDSIITRDNSVSTSFRFIGGRDNIIENFAIDGNDQAGRGIYVSDIGTTVRDLYVYDCPDRPIGLSGGQDGYYGVTLPSDTTPNITAITLANPGQVTTDAPHGLTTGEFAALVNPGGTVEVEDTRFTVTVIDANNFTIGVDTTSYTPFTSGGTVEPKNFFPTDCKAVYNKVKRVGRTGISTYAMTNAVVSFNDIEDVYSEGFTLDHGLRNTAIGNSLTNVCQTDRHDVWPSIFTDTDLDGISGGGVGGIGCGGMQQSVIAYNTIIGVQLTESTLIDRYKPGIHPKNAAGEANGCKFIGNHIEDAKTGIYLPDVAEGNGATGENLNHIIIGNTFKTIGQSEGRVSGTNLDVFGDVFLEGDAIDQIIRDNKNMDRNLLITGDRALNHIEDDSSHSQDDDTLPVLYGGSTAGTGTYSTQRLLQTRVGRTVTFTVNLEWTAHTGSGQLRMSGLSHANKTLLNNVASFPCEVDGITATGQVFARMNSGDDFLRFVVVNDGSTSNLSVATPGTYSLVVSGTYTTED